MTQEFHLCVTCLGHHTYQIETQQVPQKLPLVAEVVEWQIENWLIHAEQLKAAVNKSDRSYLYPNLRALGKQLYQALITGKIKDTWNAARNFATQEQSVLLLSLEIAADDLASVPWELLYEQECFLVSDSQISLKINRVQVPSDQDLTQIDWDEVIHDLYPEDEKLMLEFAEDEWDEPLIDDQIDSTYAEDSAVVADIFNQLAASPDSITQEHTPQAVQSNNSSTTQYKKTSAQDVSIALMLGTVMMAIMAITTLLWGYQQPRQIAVSLTPLGLSRLNHRNWQAASTQEITAIAIAKFQQGDVRTAQNLVEELLNRNALSNASIALNAVPAQSDSILYLRGRLAWQSSQVEQARRYWESAVEQNPQIKYYNALGFAYYAQDNLNQANEAWFEALYLASQLPTQQTTTINPNHSNNRELLTAYAGLALVLHHSAQTQPLDKQTKFTNEAIKLRKKVFAEDPVNFRPQQLNSQWLWDQKAVADWRSLLQSRQQPSGTK